MTLNEANNAYFDNVETLKSFNEDKNKFTNRITALETKHMLAVQAKESYDSFGRAIQLLMSDMKVNPELKKVAGACCGNHQNARGHGSRNGRRFRQRAA